MNLNSWKRNLICVAAWFEVGVAITCLSFLVRGGVKGFIWDAPDLARIIYLILLADGLMIIPWITVGLSPALHKDRAAVLSVMKLALFFVYEVLDITVDATEYQLHVEFGWDVLVCSLAGPTAIWIALRGVLLEGFARHARKMAVAFIALIALGAYVSKVMVAGMSFGIGLPSPDGKLCALITYSRDEVAIKCTEGDYESGGDPLFLFRYPHSYSRKLADALAVTEIIWSPRSDSFTIRYPDEISEKGDWDNRPVLYRIDVDLKTRALNLNRSPIAVAPPSEARESGTAVEERAPIRPDP